jgi:hypothetical protein
MTTEEDAQTRLESVAVRFSNICQREGRLSPCARCKDRRQPQYFQRTEEAQPRREIPKFSPSGISNLGKSNEQLVEVPECVSTRLFSIPHCRTSLFHARWGGSPHAEAAGCFTVKRCDSKDIPKTRNAAAAALSVMKQVNCWIWCSSFAHPARASTGSSLCWYHSQGSECNMSYSIDLHAALAV